MPDAASSSSGVDMARPPTKRPLRGDVGAGGRGHSGLASPAASAPSNAGAGLTTRVALTPSDGEDLAPHSDDLLEVEDDDDVHEDAAALFGIDLVGDGSQPNPINLDADNGGVEALVMMTAWGRIFGGPGASPIYFQSSSAAPSVVIESELKSYLDADPVTCYEETFDILLWWCDHKLTYSVVSIIVRDIMSVPVSTISSESCFTCTSRILEDRRRRLLPEHVEMLTYITDRELEARREQHTHEDTDLEEAFKNLFLDDQGSSQGNGSGTGSGGTAAGG